MPRPNDTDEDGVSIDKVRVLRATERALLCVLPDSDGTDREMWVPKSQVTDDSEVSQTGDEGTLVVRAWFADREGLGQ